MDIVLFPFVNYWWLYLAFSAAVMVLITLDLGVFHRTPHAISAKEATVWSCVWIALALLFNYLLYQYSLWRFALDPRLTSIPGFAAAPAAKQIALEFLTGYIIEKSLSIDNIFVFVVIFRYFAIEPKYQHRILFFGLLGALCCRAVFIGLGAVLMGYKIVIVVLGCFLILTGIKMMFSPEKPIEPEKNPVIRLLKRLVPVTTEFHGQKFMIKSNGRSYATPLLVALVFLEFTDIIFAVDSVPAIFAITDEPLVVYTSNIFAILGLRSLYFLLVNAVEKFHLLKYGLSIVLIFVGSKMVFLNNLFGGKFPVQVSLMIISGVIGLSILLSFVMPQRESRN